MCVRQRLLAVAALLASVSSAEDNPVCGLRSAGGKLFVRNGQAVNNSTEVPWHVSVYDLKSKDGPAQICGGTLIKANFFVSAGHCFYKDRNPRPASDFAATVGSRFLDWNETEDTKQRVQFNRILFHTYGGRDMLYRNDIALVQLATEVIMNANVLPICIDWGMKLPNLRTGVVGLVAGFGGFNDSPYKTLQYSNLPFLDRAACRSNISSSLRFYTTVSDKFCVGVANGSAVGPGDSGGGIAFETDGQWFLRGIVSLGDAYHIGNSFFTNVAEHITWMSQITNGLVVPNLTDACLKCMCDTITACNETLGCIRGYCGPFYISKVFWKDAGKPLLPEDDPVRPGAFEDCARDYKCAASAVTNYMSRFGKDCNGDGTTDCDDYLLIHFYGPKGCGAGAASLSKDVDPIQGANLTERYENCRQDAES